MNRDRWTIVLLAGEDGPIRQVSVPGRHLRIAAGVGAAVSLLLIVLFTTFGLEGLFRVEARLLREQNRVLTAQLAQVQGRIAALDQEVSGLGERDREARLLAGLTPIDEEIIRVGVGGPGSRSLEDHPAYAVDPELGGQLFAAEYDLGAMERRVGLFRSSMAEALDSLQAHHDLLLSTPSILPTAGLFRSGFTDARLHPLLHQTRPHEGIDIAAPRGTPILAAARGRVVESGWQNGYGITVEIDHGYGYRTVYSHAEKSLVGVGQWVDRGDVIAQVGSSGLTTSPHLHYEVRVNGRAVNPENFILQGAIP
jgi:murein DD-endopeptidase MepM/ murein hydrolase activator NlpD